MTATVAELVGQITPTRTVLLFGAGASVQCEAPSSGQLVRAIATRFGFAPEGLNLREISGLAERKQNRRELIECVRSEFKHVKPKGSILNLPLYEWRSLFTTNYDEVVEDSYARAGRQVIPFSSNFDFTAHTDPTATKLFKLHGTLSKDVADGNVSRMILTDFDYDLTQDFREQLWGRLSSELTEAERVVIIGQSLADEDLRTVVQKAIDISQKTHSAGRITLLLYTPDVNRATLYEHRGIKVAFGSLDDFFSELAKKSTPVSASVGQSDDYLDLKASLRAETISVAEELAVSKPDASAIFNGWPARMAEIVAGFTFERTVSGEIAELLRTGDATSVVLLGASGVGKTTAARQAAFKLHAAGFHVWEHKADYPLDLAAWRQVAQKLQADSQTGVLLIDDAHSHLYEINDLADGVSALRCDSLKLILVSSRNHWGPRVKSPHIYTTGRELVLSQLNHVEVDRLLNLVESVPQVRALVEAGFGGFSRAEQRRRLVDRCEADMFVCLKNIFASEKFDDIILREFASLGSKEQDVYRYVAAMEHSGIRVHRQLVMRLLGISASHVAGVLSNLEDIVSEYDISPREGIYGWRVRHMVIAGIITKYKFSDLEQLIQLFNTVIDQISPTYDIEIRTIRELCNIESGLQSIPDRGMQNVLLRKMMSIAPGERVPRHRLIRNLIELGEFEKAESEIRIFEKDFRRDGPVVRYRILLLIARATETPDILQEDRKAILEQARELAASACNQYHTNKTVLAAYCEVGVATLRICGTYDVYDAAMAALRKAETRLGDPDITRLIQRYERRVSGQAAGSRSELQEERDHSAK